jgi:YgiT-type zinc finger domain-containing protein
LLPTRRTYVTQYGETLVHSADFPALKCDTCRLVIFDEDALNRLDLLVGEAGPPPNVPAGQARHAADPPAAEPSARDDSPDEPPRPDRA